MEPLLIVIVFILVVVIGYILSRPFENPPQTPPKSPKSDQLENPYESLLLEIKELQYKRETANDPGDLDRQIEAKKRQAADLLRQTDPGR